MEYQKTITVSFYSEISNPYVDALVSFTKQCTPSFADIGDTITITYRVSNLATGAATPVISSILIEDPFLMQDIPEIEITEGENEVNYNQTTGTFNIALSSGDLSHGDPDAVATFTYVVLSTHV